MSKYVEMRGVKIGEGMPKICVPVAEKTLEDISKSLNGLLSASFDLVEWRVDHFEVAFDEKEVLNALELIREKLSDKPLLFTFRTAKEGGEKDITPEKYLELISAAIDSGLVDAVDVEVFMGDEIVSEIVCHAHEKGVVVIASNHDFDKTPSKDEIVKRLCKMQSLGADIPKIAVMPNTKKDVLVLLEATEEMVREHADRPVITMSMSGDGVISRLCGEVFGSALTFGTAGKASAPGQIDSGKLSSVLSIIHESL